MKILFFGESERDKKEHYTNTLPGHELVFLDHDLSEDKLPKDRSAEIISIFVKSKMTKQVIDNFPNLRMIAVRATGFDNIDLEYAKQKNIIVSNVPAYGSHTVAEFAFGLILSLSRKIPQAIERVKTKKKFDHTGLRGFDLFGKTLGVVGTGKIGANVIKIASGFGMKIIACDSYPNQDLVKTYDFKYVLLDQLLKEANIITIHVPSLPETHHLINSKNISLVKDGSLIINTARGDIIETAALVAWLKRNKLGAAGLDVLEDEKELTSKEKGLLKLPNVIVTPHTAFYTLEAEQAIAETTSENIKQFILGKTQNQVN